MSKDFYKHDCFYCKYSEVHEPYEDDDIEEIYCYKHKKYIVNPLDEHINCFDPWYKKKE